MTCGEDATHGTGMRANVSSDKEERSHDSQVFERVQYERGVIRVRAVVERHRDRRC